MEIIIIIINNSTEEFEKQLTCSDKNTEKYIELPQLIKCLCCNKNYQKKFDEKLKKRFLITYKFSNHDVNFIVGKRCLLI